MVGRMFRRVPGARRLARRLGGLDGDNIVFRGNYASWDEAARDADGYDVPFILERVREASRTARKRDDRLERDGVLFEQPQWNFALIAGLLRTANECGGSLSVLDVLSGKQYTSCVCFCTGYTLSLTERTLPPG